jgi:hypothetical protein
MHDHSKLIPGPDTGGYTPGRLSSMTPLERKIRMSSGRHSVLGRKSRERSASVLGEKSKDAEQLVTDEDADDYDRESWHESRTDESRGQWI